MARFLAHRAGPPSRLYTEILRAVVERFPVWSMHVAVAPSAWPWTHKRLWGLSTMRGLGPEVARCSGLPNALWVPQS